MWDDEDDWSEEFESMNDEPFYLVRHEGLYNPAPLAKGDKIGIVSLSGYDPDEVIGAMSVISSYGYIPVLSEAVQNSKGESGIIPRGDRIIELHKMIEDTEIKAIFCCGDGSGSIEILPNFSYGPIAKNPKWLVGNGNITALLSMWVVSDIASIYGPMCGDMMSEGPGVKSLFNLLATGGKLDYILPTSPYNRRGKAIGRLIGGNLSVLTFLGGTSYDLIGRFAGSQSNERECILFFEDSGISLRNVRDMLLRLYLKGTTFFIKGLIFGSFIDCEPYGNLHSIRDVVDELSDRWMLPPDIPIVFDFPIGKETSNIPLVEGVNVELEVAEDQVSIRGMNAGS